MAAAADYDGAGPYERDKIEYYYRRLEFVTGRTLNLGWWYRGYDATVADRLAEAARLEGSSGNEVRLALASAALHDGLQITKLEIGLDVAAEAARLSVRQLQKAIENPEEDRRLAESKARYLALGAPQRPLYHLTNQIGDTVLLSGLWRSDVLRSAVEELLADEERILAFPALSTD